MLKKLYDEMTENYQLKFETRKMVYGEGNSHSPIIMLIGESPGANEEKEGHPFIGSAGKNLDRFLNMISLKRENIFISNVVKIRPFKLSPKTGKPINRTPNAAELEFFIPYLKREIDCVSPKIIVTLGNTPLHAVCGKNNSIGDLHGKPIEKRCQIVFPLYHPAAIIYDNKLNDTYEKDVFALAEYMANVSRQSTINNSECE